MIQKIRDLAAANQMTPMPAAPQIRPALVELGRMLAFDKVLSGNRDISCMTCHHPTLATGDARSLAIGQGATGLGVTRVHPNGTFIHRNAPPLYNLHAMSSLFWDGRVEVVNGVLTTPAGAQITPELAAVFEFGAVSAQAMFPVTSRSEMRGSVGQNAIANLSDDDLGAIWAALMHRIHTTQAYRPLFEAAYPGTQFHSTTFAHVANAIAAFEIATFEMGDTPWDRFLAGDDSAMTVDQLKGAESFVEKGHCEPCHNGAALTNLRFFDTGLAQVGPGLGDGPLGNDDFGRMRVTGNPTQQYKFRTTPLRNVALTGPWGHAGEIVDLRDFVAHYFEADEKLLAWDATQLEPALQGTVVDNFDGVLANLSLALDQVQVNTIEIDRIALFMGALTDPAALDQTDVVPAAVPSGLPVD